MCSDLTVAQQSANCQQSLSSFVKYFGKGVVRLTLGLFLHSE